MAFGINNTYLDQSSGTTVNTSGASNAGRNWDAVGDADSYAKLMNNINSQSGDDSWKKAKLLYDTALGLAQTELADSEPDDIELKDSISKHLNNLQDQQDGGDRMSVNQIKNTIGQGESALTGASDAIRRFNRGIGGLGDALFDNTVGNAAAGLLGEEAGNTVKNLFDAKGLEGVVSLGEDILLNTAGNVLLPGLGTAASVAKNVAEQGSTIDKALTGKDTITGKELSDQDKLGQAGLAGLAVGMSAIPGGIGKAARGATKMAGKEVAETGLTKEAGKLAKEVSEDATKKVANITDDVAKNADELAEQTTKANTASEGLINNAKELANGEEIKLANKNVDVNNKLLNNADQAIKKDAQVVQDILKSDSSLGKEYGKNISKNQKDLDYINNSIDKNNKALQDINLTDSDGKMIQIRKGDVVKGDNAKILENTKKQLQEKIDTDTYTKDLETTDIKNINPKEYANTFKDTDVSKQYLERAGNAAEAQNTKKGIEETIKSKQAANTNKLKEANKGIEKLEGRQEVLDEALDTATQAEKDAANAAKGLQRGDAGFSKFEMPTEGLSASTPLKTLRDIPKTIKETATNTSAKDVGKAGADKAKSGLEKTKNFILYGKDKAATQVPKNASEYQKLFAGKQTEGKDLIKNFSDKLSDLVDKDGNLVEDAGTKIGQLVKDKDVKNLLVSSRSSGTDVAEELSGALKNLNKGDEAPLRQLITKYSGMATGEGLDDAAKAELANLTNGLNAMQNKAYKGVTTQKGLKSKGVEAIKELAKDVIPAAGAVYASSGGDLNAVMNNLMPGKDENNLGGILTPALIMGLGKKIGSQQLAKQAVSKPSNIRGRMSNQGLTRQGYLNGLGSASSGSAYNFLKAGALADQYTGSNYISGLNGDSNYSSDDQLLQYILDKSGQIDDNRAAMNAATNKNQVDKNKLKLNSYNKQVV